MHLYVSSVTAGLSKNQSQVKNILAVLKSLWKDASLLMKTNNQGPQAGKNQSL